MPPGTTNGVKYYSELDNVCPLKEPPSFKPDLDYLQELGNLVLSDFKVATSKF